MSKVTKGSSKSTVETKRVTRRSVQLAESKNVKPIGASRDSARANMSSVVEPQSRKVNMATPSKQKRQVKSKIDTGRGGNTRPSSVLCATPVEKQMTSMPPNGRTPATSRTNSVSMTQSKYKTTAKSTSSSLGQTRRDEMSHTFSIPATPGQSRKTVMSRIDTGRRHSKSIVSPHPKLTDVAEVATFKKVETPKCTSRPTLRPRSNNVLKATEHHSLKKATRQSTSGLSSRENTDPIMTRRRSVQARSMSH